MADDAAGTGTAAAAAAPGEAAPTQQQAPRRVVLFAVGDDDLSERAFAWAVDPSSGGGNLLRDGDAVHLLHVIVAEGGRDLRLDYFDQRAEADVLAAQQPLLERRFVSKLRAAGWGTLPVVIHLVEASQDAGTLARVVCKRARQLGAALVVIGRHEHSRLREFFLGSAGESVARELKHDSVEVRLVREADLASAGGSSSGADGGGGGAEAS